jgi:hypothetical protein
MLLSKELLAIQLDEPGLVDRWGRDARAWTTARRAEALATYFSLAEGRQKLAAGARGVAARRLSLPTLRKVRVDPYRILSVPRRSAAGSVAERLDVVIRQVLVP